jgi:hypothetical protein
MVLEHVLIHNCSRTSHKPSIPNSLVEYEERAGIPLIMSHGQEPIRQRAASEGKVHNMRHM